MAPIILGFLIGAGFLAIVEHRMHKLSSQREQSAGVRSWGGRVGVLVFLAMTFHSIPEGVAVGVGYTSDSVGGLAGDLRMGTVLALAIAIHNIPEGLAVGVPMRAAGASFGRCFLAAFLTSLPQPLAAIPAVLLAWFFQPLMPLLMGFAAGAMIFLVILELIPDALDIESPPRIAWAFTFGFCAMLLVQVALQGTLPF